MITRARNEVVQDLLAMRRPLDDVARDLKTFPFECDPSDVETLTRRQAIRLLDAFVDEELPLEELEYWAMIVALRDDISYEGDSEAIKEMVYVLAHPGANRRLDPDRAQIWIDALDAEAKSSQPTKRAGWSA